MLKSEIMDLISAKFYAAPAGSRFEHPKGTPFRHIDNNISLLVWELRDGSTVLHTFSKGLGTPQRCIAFEFLHGQATPVHQHDYIELAYVVSGTFSQNICGKDYTFRENDVVIINQDMLHCDYLRAKSGCILFLNIPNALFQQLFGGDRPSYSNFVADLLLKRRSDYSHIHAALKPQAALGTQESAAARSILQIVREICDSGPGAEHIIHGNLIRTIYCLSREYELSLPGYSVRDMRRLLYDEVLNEMRANCRDVTVEDLQKKYFYQRDYFNRLIKEYSGFTFRELRQRLRLEEAGKLLLETDMRVEEVSLAVGYENQGFFYRIFTEHYGATPRAYRVGRKR